MLGTAILTALIDPAQACGGFFCSNVPIEQSSEDIVFAIDKPKGEITMHVQIAYTGSAEEFAWIVPVPQVPELVLSTDRLFQELGWRTQPRFRLNIEEIFECSGYGYYGYPEALGGGYSPSSASTPSLDNGTVDVVSQQRVGPYDTVILRAQSAEGLLNWLQDNAYLLPDALDAVLAPYVANESYFVALKLAKDNDVGALAPLALTYRGTAASIPIQLTSIAATEDMRLRAYVLGSHRAVPDSYLHVKVNDLVVDWFRGGYNWEQAITVAADEAGGHAFATDYSGSSDVLDGALFVEGRFDVAALARATNPYDFFDQLLRQGFAGDSTMLALFREFLPMPPALAAKGVREQDFYNCLQCWSEWVDAIPFDSVAFAAAVDERVVTPLRNAQAMVDAYPHLTRLTSSVSPVEMTVDPTFVFNADMQQDVQIERSATLEILCGWGGEFTESPRRLVLADGRFYNLPSMQWFRDNGTTEYDYLSQLFGNYALVIEHTSGEGEPEVLFDGTLDARDAADAFNAANGGDLTPPGGACGCQHGGGAGAALGLVGLLGLAYRRRRA